MATYIISDIHGNQHTFQKLLKNINLCDKDILIIIGDIIDRSYNSKGVIDDILKLKLMGYNIQCLKGNHEDLLLNADVAPYLFDVWCHNGGVQTLHSYGIEVKGYKNPDYTITYEWIPHFKKFIPKEHLDFLQSLPTVLEIDNFIMVHAGLGFYYDEPVKETDDYNKMWERMFTYDPSKVQNRILLTGHTPQDRSTIIDMVEKTKKNGYGHIIIDNGCFQGLTRKDQYERGSLCCLNLDTMEVVFEQCVD